MSFTGKLLSFAAVSSLAVSAAFAQSLPPSVAACTSEKDSLARLVCFDREVAKYTQSAARVAPTPAVPPVMAPPDRRVVETPPQVASPKHDEFGLNPSIERKRDQTRAEEDRALKELHAAITKVATKPYGEFILTLDNGQVWEQLERSETFIIKAGDGIVIKKAKLGSFLLTADSGATTRVRRVR
jgi:hypothetical protein